MARVGSYLTAVNSELCASFSVVLRWQYNLPNRVMEGYGRVRPDTNSHNITDPGFPVTLIGYVLSLL